MAWQVQDVSVSKNKKDKVKGSASRSMLQSLRDCLAQIPKGNLIDNI